MSWCYGFFFHDLVCFSRDLVCFWYHFMVFSHDMVCFWYHFMVFSHDMVCFWYYFMVFSHDMVWFCHYVVLFCCYVISISLIGYKNHNFNNMCPLKMALLNYMYLLFLVIRPPLTSCTLLPMTTWSFVKEQLMRYWIFYLSYKISCISRQMVTKKKPLCLTRNWKRYYQSFILTGKLVVMLYLYKQVL